MRPTLLAALFLVACGGPSVESIQVRGPDGSQHWWSIHCRDDMATCVEEAGRVCSFGYQVVSSGGRVAEEKDRAASFASGYNGGDPVYHNVFRGEMLVKCKEPGQDKWAYRGGGPAITSP